MSLYVCVCVLRESILDSNIYYINCIYCSNCIYSIIYII